MKSFSFRLERVLEVRRKQLEVEERKFRLAAAEVAAVNRARAELEATAVRTEYDVRGWERVGGCDLGALGEYRSHVRAEEGRLASRRAECVRALADAEAAMLEARRRCRLLERLKERRVSEWKAECDRELEEVAAESYLARWSSGTRTL